MLRASPRRRNRRSCYWHHHNHLGLDNTGATERLDHPDSEYLAFRPDYIRITHRRRRHLCNEPQTTILNPHFFVQDPSSQDAEAHAKHIFSCSQCERDIRVTSQNTVRKTIKMSSSKLRANSSTTTRISNAPIAKNAPENTRTELL